MGSISQLWSCARRARLIIIDALLYSTRGGLQEAEFVRQQGSGLYGEGEVDSWRFAAFPHVDFRTLRAQRFVPGRQRIVPRGKIWDFEAALVVGNGKKRSLQDNEVTLRPGMQ